MEISKPNTLCKGCCAKVRMTSKQQFSHKISLMPEFLKAFFCGDKTAFPNDYAKKCAKYQN